MKLWLGQVLAESLKSAFLIFHKLPKLGVTFLKAFARLAYLDFFDQPDFFHKKLGLLAQADRQGFILWPVNLSANGVGTGELKYNTKAKTKFFCEKKGILILHKNKFNNLVRSFSSYQGFRP